MLEVLRVRFSQTTALGCCASWPPLSDTMVDAPPGTVPEAGPSAVGGAEREVDAVAPAAALAAVSRLNGVMVVMDPL